MAYRVTDGDTVLNFPPMGYGDATNLAVVLTNALGRQFRATSDLASPPPAYIAVVDQQGVQTLAMLYQNRWYSYNTGRLLSSKVTSYRAIGRGNWHRPQNDRYTDHLVYVAQLTSGMFCLVSHDKDIGWYHSNTGKALSTKLDCITLLSDIPEEPWTNT
jgi:hypothetical protein